MTLQEHKAPSQAMEEMVDIFRVLLKNDAVPQVRHTNPPPAPTVSQPQPSQLQSQAGLVIKPWCVLSWLHDHPPSQGYPARQPPNKIHPPPEAPTDAGLASQSQPRCVSLARCAVCGLDHMLVRHPSSQRSLEEFTEAEISQARKAIREEVRVLCVLVADPWDDHIHYRVSKYPPLPESAQETYMPAL